MPIPRGDTTRLVVGALLPAPLGVFLLFFWAALESGQPVSRLLDPSWLTFVAFGSVMMSLQSLVYSFVMEFAVNRRLRSHVAAVACGGALGLIAGVSAGQPFFVGGPAIDLIVVGGVAGLLVACLLRYMFVRPSNTYKDSRVKAQRFPPHVVFPF